MGHPAFMYRKDCIIGKIFDSDTLPELIQRGWVDHPNKIDKGLEIEEGDVIEPVKEQEKRKRGRPKKR